MNLFKHLHTINSHRRLVRHECFKLGLYWQGLTHDLSKYSPTEFFRGVRYYQGFRSPIVGERNERGISEAWMHHKGRNKHHYEYWTDYSKETDNFLEPVKMPVNYFAESVADRIAACKIYQGDKYTDASPYEYFVRRDKARHMHIETYKELEKVLIMLKDEGEDVAFEYLRQQINEDRKKKHANKA